MPTQERPYVDFQEVKRVIPLPDVFAVLGLTDRFRQIGQTLAGVCPLPQHQHGPYPNPEQFKAQVRDGLWLWHCFGDCQRGGDVIEFVKLMTGFSNSHVRLWFAEHFGDRLTLKKPTRDRDQPPPETKEAREVRQTPQRAEVEPSTQTLPSEPTPIKSLRFHLKLQTDVPYLRQRGLSDETIRRYGLGLCTKGMLAGYIAIPVYPYPPTSHPVAYLGRWPGDDHDEAAGRPRYKWPAGFPKQRFLYGLAEALQTPADQPLIVVEGPFSVYHLVQSGLGSAVAAFGSILSEDQADQLAATGRSVLLLFDGDAAGQTGTRAAVERLATRTFVRAVQLDPDSKPDVLSPADLSLLLR